MTISQFYTAIITRDWKRYYLQCNNLQEEEKEREEDDAAAVAAGEDAMNANQSPESEYDRDREVMQRCVKLILQGRPQIMMPLTPKVWKKDTMN